MTNKFQHARESIFAKISEEERKRGSMFKKKPLCMFLKRCEHLTPHGTCDFDGECKWQSKTPEEDKAWARRYLNE